MGIVIFMSKIWASHCSFIKSHLYCFGSIRDPNIYCIVSKYQVFTEDGITLSKYMDKSYNKILNKWTECV